MNGALKTQKRGEKRGFVSLIILTIIALVILQYAVGINVIGFIQSSFFGQFLIGVKNIILALWDAITRALTATT